MPATVLNKLRPDGVSSRCEKQPGVTGPCRSHIPRWTFDNGRCRQFSYGGCAGNGNRFVKKNQCEEKCINNNEGRIIFNFHVENYLLRLFFAVCMEEPGLSGPCRGFLPRWTFNNGLCRMFYYGGCRGNNNNFKTYKQCKDNCKHLNS